MNEPPPLPETPAPSAPSQPPMSLAARLTNVFVAPGEVFDEVKTAPPSAANWLVPAVLLAAVTLVGAGIIYSQAPINHQLEEMVDKQLERAHVSGPQADAARSISLLVTKVSMTAGPAVGAFIMPFWSGLVIWVIGAKVLKGRFGYMKAVEAGGLGNMISVLDAVVKVPLVIVVGNVFATLSLGLLVKDFNPQEFTHGLLALVNVMLIWGLLVQSIALAQLSGRSLAVAAAWVFGVTISITGVFMGFGFAMKLAFKH